MTIRILETNDHSVVRLGLPMFLELDVELEIVGEAANGAEAVELARELQPDVVLMDLLMPVMDGISAISAIRREMPGVEVVALTSGLEDAPVVGAVRAGAIGYLLKDTNADELRRAVKAPAQVPGTYALGSSPWSLWTRDLCQWLDTDIAEGNPAGVDLQPHEPG